MRQAVEKRKKPWNKPGANSSGGSFGNPKLKRRAGPNEEYDFEDEPNTQPTINISPGGASARESISSLMLGSTLSSEPAGIAMVDMGPGSAIGVGAPQPRLASQAVGSMVVGQVVQNPGKRGGRLAPLGQVSAAGLPGPSQAGGQGFPNPVVLGSAPGIDLFEGFPDVDDLPMPAAPTAPPSRAPSTSRKAAAALQPTAIGNPPQPAHVAPVAVSDAIDRAHRGVRVQGAHSSATASLVREL